MRLRKMSVAGAAAAAVAAAGYGVLGHGPGFVHDGSAPAAAVQRVDVSSVLGANDQIVPFAPKVGSRNETLFRASISCVDEHGGDGGETPPALGSADVPAPFRACLAQQKARTAFGVTGLYPGVDLSAEAQAGVVWSCLWKAGMRFDIAGSDLYAVSATTPTVADFADTLTTCRDRASTSEE